MKKKLVIVTVLCLAAGTLAVVFLVTLQRHNLKRARIVQLPAFEARDIEGGTFVSSSLSRYRRSAILFFSPDCEFCRTELKNIVMRGNQWEDVCWLFVTMSDKTTVEDFLMECDVEAIPNSRVVIDEKGSIISLFAVSAPPTLFIYDENLLLIHIGKGATSISTIMEWLQ